MAIDAIDAIDAIEDMDAIEDIVDVGFGECGHGWDGRDKKVGFAEEKLRLWGLAWAKRGARHGSFI